MLTYEYISISNLPEKSVNKVIADYKISKAALKKLNQKGIEVILTKRINRLYEAVSSHADMQIHHLEKDIFVCEPTVYDYYRNMLQDVRLISGKVAVKAEYPFDIAYNICRVGDFVFHNFKYTDSKIYEYYEKIGVKLINVKQGYSKCSICPITEKAVITSDIKIYKSCENIMDVLYFNPHDIVLNGLNNGLVGGICGKISKNILAVNGDITLCTDGYKFIDFCQKHHVDVCNLTDSKPVDIGSIIPITQNKCSGW
ncbi:MAG: hypothetical protein IJD30_02920 [Clostridia bacterium]|nr:hypothetical protein [Clostridia bacterium]